MSYARLQCMKSTRFCFTGAAIGHFISKEDTKITKFETFIIRTSVSFVNFVVR